MKKILVFASVMSVLALVACGDTATKNEACVVKVKGNNSFCTEVAGADYADADCAKSGTAYGATATGDTTVVASSSCPTSSTVNCEMKDAAGKVTGVSIYGYGDSTSLGYGMAMMMCHPESIFQGLEKK